MVFELIKEIKSTKAEVRKFAVTIGIFLGFLGGLLFLRQRDYYFYFFIVSIRFLFLGLLAPGLLRPIQKIWMCLAITIGRFVT